MVSVLSRHTVPQNHIIDRYIPLTKVLSLKKINPPSSLACRCREKAAGKYKYFALGYYGECWGSVKTAADELIASAYGSSSCVDGSYQACGKHHTQVNDNTSTRSTPKGPSYHQQEISTISTCVVWVFTETQSILFTVSQEILI